MRLFNKICWVITAIAMCLTFVICCEAYGTCKGANQPVNYRNFSIAYVNCLCDNTNAVVNLVKNGKIESQDDEGYEAHLRAANIAWYAYEQVEDAQYCIEQTKTKLNNKKDESFKDYVKGKFF